MKKGTKNTTRTTSKPRVLRNRVVQTAEVVHVEVQPPPPTPHAPAPAPVGTINNHSLALLYFVEQGDEARAHAVFADVPDKKLLAPSALEAFLAMVLRSGFVHHAAVAAEALGRTLTVSQLDGLFEKALADKTLGDCVRGIKMVKDDIRRAEMINRSFEELWTCSAPHALCVVAKLLPDSSAVKARLEELASVYIEGLRLGDWEIVFYELDRDLNDKEAAVIRACHHALAKDLLVRAVREHVDLLDIVIAKCVECGDYKGATEAAALTGRLLMHDEFRGISRALAAEGELEMVMQIARERLGGKLLDDDLALVVAAWARRRERCCFADIFSASAGPASAEPALRARILQAIAQVSMTEYVARFLGHIVTTDRLNKFDRVFCDEEALRSVAASCLAFFVQDGDVDSANNMLSALGRKLLPEETEALVRALMLKGKLEAALAVASKNSHRLTAAHFQLVSEGGERQNDID